jgi:hypothetical protein
MPEADLALLRSVSDLVRLQEWQKGAVVEGQLGKGHKISFPVCSFDRSEVSRWYLAVHI